MTIMTAPQLASLMQEVASKHSMTLTPTQEVLGVSIMLAESSGDTTAVNQNSDGSLDRGLWQWNNKAWPQITDAIAYDPVASTEMAYAQTNGFTPTSFAAIWHDSNGNLSKGLSAPNIETTAQVLNIDPTNIHVPVGASGHADGGRGLPDLGPAIVASTGLTGLIFEGLSGGLSSWSDIAKLVGSLLSHILSVDFWKRVGIIVLAITIIIGALILIFRDDITKTATDAAKVAAL